MIDYLKLETSLKKFFDYEAKKKYDEKTDKIFKKVGIIVSKSLNKCDNN